MVNVSVCIPVYNVAPYVAQCARSLFEQTMKNGIEFIFVDDRSSDGSVEKVQTVLSEYPDRIGQTKFIQNKKNFGQTATRHVAMRAAAGEYIAFCDSDDWVDEDYYQTLYDGCAQNDADMSYCGYTDEFSSGSPVVHRLPACGTGDEVLKNHFPEGGFNSVCNKLIKKEIAVDLAIVNDPSIKYGEDVLYLAQVLRNCKKVVYCDDVGYHYRQNPSSVMHKENGVSQVKQMCVILKHFEALFTTSEYSNLIDRQIRNILVKAVRYGGLNAEAYRAFCRRMNSPLLADSRLTHLQKIALFLAGMSYETVHLLVSALDKIKNG